MALRLSGQTSGYVELEAPAVAGDNTVTLPTSNGAANQVLKNGATAGQLEYGLTLPSGNGTSGQYLQTAGDGTTSWQTIATPTIIEAFGYNEANGGTASSDTIISSFTSLDFSNYEGNLLQVFGRTTINESGGDQSATAALYVEITDGTNTTVIAGSRNGNPYGNWSGNFQLDISTSSLYTIPSTYATTGITLRLRASTNSGTFAYGDQPSYTNFDDLGDGINGGIGFQYIVFG